VTPEAPPPSRVTVTALTPPRAAREELADDVRRGLSGADKSLPPKHLYDARGSELFERITELPEYPVTRAETAVLEQAAGELIASSRPAELLELGSGSSRKTRLLLEAMHDGGTGDRYAPLDVSSAAIERAAAELVAAYPWLTVHGYVGDFHTDLGRVPRDGRRLVAFLGSTIGNLARAERHTLFEAVAASLEEDDRFLLGAHLVAPAEVLEPAYDDASGVTAQFTTNLLVVLNRELDGDLPVEAFRHVAEWDPAEERVTLSLEATRDVHAHLATLDLDVNFRTGERLVVEHSHKFHVPRLTGELAAAGMTVEQCHGRDGGGFVSLLARRSDPVSHPELEV
jgi:L-histidine Nalpha-methyltransferase